MKYACYISVETLESAIAMAAKVKQSKNNIDFINSICIAPYKLSGNSCIYTPELKTKGTNIISELSQEEAEEIILKDPKLQILLKTLKTQLKNKNLDYDFDGIRIYKEDESPYISLEFFYDEDEAIESKKVSEVKKSETKPRIKNSKANDRPVLFKI